MDCNDVLKELAKSSGEQFDPTLVPLFLELDFSAYRRMVDGHEIFRDQATPPHKRENMS
jgi:HD-GYP domain-containing protein (c-di-GMP phosphodiesterase class II)